MTHILDYPNEKTRLFVDYKDDLLIYKIHRFYSVPVYFYSVPGSNFKSGEKYFKNVFGFRNHLFDEKKIIEIIFFHEKNLEVYRTGMRNKNIEQIINLFLNPIILGKSPLGTYSYKILT